METLYFIYDTVYIHRDSSSFLMTPKRDINFSWHSLLAPRLTVPITATRNNVDVVTRPFLVERRYFSLIYPNYQET